jgi:arsenite-transporting ATPase
MSHQVYGQEALHDMIRAITGEPCSSAQSNPIISQLQVNMDHGREDMRALSQQRLLLFGGKGGVGKTTMAAATALYMVSQEEKSVHKTLLFSTDPAHSISDSLAQHIGNQITPVDGIPQLNALEMNSNDLYQELTRIYRAEINEVFDSFLSGPYVIEYDRQVMEELISLTPPGLDELMALMKIMDFIEEGQFDRYVLDLAPTGHTLRFLETPGMVRRWFITFFRLIVKYQGIARLTKVSELLVQKSKQLRQVQKILNDPEQCQFVTVMIPEAMAVSETKRLLGRLAGLSVTCRQVIANMVMPMGTCPFCSTVQNDQLPYLLEMKALFPGLVQVPLFPQEIRGIAGLSQVTSYLYGNCHG